MYVVVNEGSVHYRVSVLEIGVCGCKCRVCAFVVHVVLWEIFGGKMEKLTGGWREL